MLNLKEISLRNQLRISIMNSSLKEGLLYYSEMKKRRKRKKKREMEKKSRTSNKLMMKLY